MDAGRAPRRAFRGPPEGTARKGPPGGRDRWLSTTGRTRSGTAPASGRRHAAPAPGAGPPGGRARRRPRGGPQLHVGPPVRGERRPVPRQVRHVVRVADGDRDDGDARRGEPRDEGALRARRRHVVRGDDDRVPAGRRRDRLLDPGGGRSGPGGQGGRGEAQLGEGRGERRGRRARRPGRRRRIGADDEQVPVGEPVEGQQPALVEQQRRRRLGDPVGGVQVGPPADDPVHPSWVTYGSRSRPSRALSRRTRRTDSSSRSSGISPPRTASSTAFQARSRSGGLSSWSQPAFSASTGTRSSPYLVRTPSMASESVTTTPS